jgi:DNA polymerase I-like protein with 3'-5' exonuclease and polymerase domains
MQTIYTEEFNSKNDYFHVPDFEIAKGYYDYVTHRGIYVNQEVAKEHIRINNRMLDEMRQLLSNYGYAGLNPNSPLQVKSYFTSNYSEELLKKYFYVYNTRKRQMDYSFKSELIEEFNRFADDPVAEVIVRYSSTNRTVSSLSKLIELADNNSIVHPEHTYAITNRAYTNSPCVSGFDINTYKNLFTPDGYGIYELDYNQIEPRISAYVFDIKEFGIFCNDSDFYSSVAKTVLGMQTVTTEQRDIIKACWNASLYGASKAKIKQISKGVAGEKIYDLFAENATVKALWDELSDETLKSVYTLFGTEIRDVDNSRNVNNKKVKVSWKIQGSTSDVLTLAIEDLSNALKKKGYGWNSLTGLFDKDIMIYYTAFDSIKFLYKKQAFSETMIESLIEELRQEITYYVNGEVLLPMKITKFD